MDIGQGQVVEKKLMSWVSLWDNQLLNDKGGDYLVNIYRVAFDFKIENIH